MTQSTFKAAVVQMEPVYLKPEATIDKMIGFLNQAAGEEAKLVVFPEVAISGYPNWINLNNPKTVARDSDYWERYVNAAVSLESGPLETLRKTVQEHGVYLVSGLVERDARHAGVIYNSAIVIDESGAILGTHRKLTPVKHEILFYRKGDAADVKVFPTHLGTLGIAICAEHFNSLYKHSLALMGEQIHCALWVNAPPLKHVVDATARAVAIENGVFVLLACQVSGRGAPTGDSCELHFIGGSGILSPWGEYLAGPVYREETVLYADIDLRQITRIAATFKLMGRDHREDLFRLTIHQPHRDTG